VISASFGVAARVTSVLEGIGALRFPRSAPKGARLHRIVRYKFHWFAANGLLSLSLLACARTVRFRPLHRKVSRVFYFFGVIHVALFFLATAALNAAFCDPRRALFRRFRSDAANPLAEREISSL
jgi:hypothetical protein